MTTDRSLGHSSVAIAEDDWWAQLVSREIGADAKLVGVSSYVGDARVYRQGDKAWKIRRRRAALPRGMISLADEAEMLRLLGTQARHVEGDDWELVVAPWVEGQTLDVWGERAGLPQRLFLLARVTCETRRLHRRGLAHRDLRPDNIVVSPQGQPTLIDYNRAMRGGSVRMALADWVGWSGNGGSPWPFWKLCVVTILPASRKAGVRLRAAARNLLPRRPHSTLPEDLETLRTAWGIARSSRANAPGQNMAYYTFTYKGLHLQGERPWALRWEMLRDHVNFQGKRVLELGCNLGLLSAFAALSGAEQVQGVDCDADIIRAARLTAEALGANATFKQVDLMADTGWEESLAGADLVTAMSIVHWLPNPERVLRFLGKHAELLYEGHDPLEVERGRLNSIGFTQIDVLGETERGRYLLHARKRGGGDGSPA